MLFFSRHQSSLEVYTGKCFLRGKPENPLLLLGQYSDEDSDEELDNTTMEKSLVDDGQENGSMDKKSVDVEVIAHLVNDTSKDLEKRLEGDSIVEDPVQNQDENHKMLIDSATSEKVILEKEATISASSDASHSADVNSSWKMVLHEESNQYYYWNTLTGETSWAVPPQLSYQTESMGEKEIIINAEGRLDSVAGSLEADFDLDARLASYVAIDSNNHLIDANATLDIQGISEDFTAEGEQNVHIGEISKEKGQSFDVNLTEISNSSKEVTVSDAALTLLEADASFQKSGHTVLGSYTDSESMMVKEDEDDDLCTSLVNLGESLLQRLTSFKSSISHMGEQAWISKSILEVEIRLHDIKSLLPFGSSLLPFWVHCERFLKQLEVDINKHDKKSEQICDIETTPLPDETVGGEIVADINRRAVVGPTPEASPPTIDDDTRTAILEEDVACHGVEQPTESLHKVFSMSGEDVDMDVDMEVDDASTHEEPMHSNSYAEDISLPGSFVPPPDEDWVPPPPPPENELIPPPPDNEAVPPPPSDDAADPPYLLPSTYPGTTQALHYTDQYNMSYLSSNYDYYGQTSTEFLQNGVYGQAEGCQVAVPHASLYYEALPSGYPVAPVVVNPIAHVAYYDHQDGSAYPVPICSSQDVIISDHIQPVEVTINQDIDKAYKEVPASVQVPTTMPVVQSVASAAVSSTSFVAKTQKVLRAKKKTTAVVSSLRSNKKVSSLVDKWKAAKEELLEKEEEEEPLTAYELLEKKRQREIKEWHAQQIASGEAKVNANFQPLGGDWRERVKRKRARMNSETVEKSSGSSLSEGQRKPDLDEISKVLPSGWLAYWDDSTNKVYYSNAIKSETTWTRPTS
ncbi:uncharacterized protein LOC124937707 isoform X2 [Impatiens glandulifera]|uniref:uncharacterized protein LOC124937707 isoform X2 n=1 Tax=Impatiens glandulifera TaxID=253017 RepID=UPI001FB12BD1|nr:uncharacterized protein LOC124937707 isoform X2 [Impatiens glandulifera]XP_047333974.1 uncharacterized protein LOC124937707 isoform X2 [Impatiens glandulifera]